MINTLDELHDYLMSKMKFLCWKDDFEKRSEVITTNLVLVDILRWIATKQVEVLRATQSTQP